MPYRRVFFEKNLSFHIVSRAVEEAKIFQRERDCYRFIFQFYVANMGIRDPRVRGRDIIKIGQSLLSGEKISTKFIKQKHEPLVHLLDFSLVRNHYHFYLLSNVENSIPNLMQRLNNGFAKYFNLKYQRRGSLFGARYRSVSVKTNFQSDAVRRYVAVINPLDVFQPRWRIEGLKDYKKAFQFLKNYQFSSFLDQTGIRKSSILAPKEILEKYSLAQGTGREKHLEFIKQFLQQKTEGFRPLFLE
jgi:hypothetical protein